MFTAFDCAFTVFSNACLSLLLSNVLLLLLTGRSLVREDHLATEIVFLYKGSASMNKLIMTEQERRLNDKMKYSHLGAALLWCLRAHKTMKVNTRKPSPLPLALTNIRQPLPLPLSPCYDVDNVKCLTALFSYFTPLIYSV